jgi:hypothetical protein
MQVLKSAKVLKVNEGIQCLHEYIVYNDFDFYKASTNIDEMTTGALTKDQVKEIFERARLKFPNQYIEDLFREGPKNMSGELKYRDLYNMISEMKPPTTFFSILLDAPSSPERMEDYSKILAPDDRFFDLLSTQDLVHLDLNKVDLDLLKDLPRMNQLENQTRVLDVANSQARLYNFPIKLANAIISQAPGVKTEMSDSVKEELIYRAFNMRSAEKFRNIKG